jgi:heme/copper-type cytochrome/quinol oxidase subunit 2
MWQAFLNSEITFWVFIVADIILIGGLLVGFVWYLKDEKQHDKKMAERMAYLKHLESLKN